MYFLKRVPPRLLLCCVGNDLAQVGFKAFDLRFLTFRFQHGHGVAEQIGAGFFRQIQPVF